MLSNYRNPRHDVLSSSTVANASNCCRSVVSTGVRPFPYLQFDGLMKVFQMPGGDIRRDIVICRIADALHPICMVCFLCLVSVDSPTTIRVRVFAMNLVCWDAGAVIYDGDDRRLSGKGTFSTSAPSSMLTVTWQAVILQFVATHASLGPVAAGIVARLLYW